MKFEPIPILELMIGFYQQARGVARFKDYIDMMTSDKSNHLDLPLPFFNPMAKEHVMEKLLDLQALDLEQEIQKLCDVVNGELPPFPDLPEKTIQVAFSLADDLKGGWTNKYSTHYANTFNPRGMLNYNFASPLFWTSEAYNIELIQTRVEETLWRTVFHLRHSYPSSLLQHLEQEAFVQNQMHRPLAPFSNQDQEWLVEVFQEYKNSEGPSDILSFLYGDPAAESLGYPAMGLEADAGFKYARHLI